MEMEFIKKIESNIAELEARLKKNTEFVTNTNSTIEKLVSERTNILDETNRVMGALQAFRFSLSEISGAKEALEDKAEKSE